MATQSASAEAITPTVSWQEYSNVPQIDTLTALRLPFSVTAAVSNNITCIILWKRNVILSILLLCYFTNCWAVIDWFGLRKWCLKHMHVMSWCLCFAAANKNTLEMVQYGVEGSSTFLECQARSPHAAIKWHLQRDNSDRRKEVSSHLWRTQYHSN